MKIADFSFCLVFMLGAVLYACKSNVADQSVAKEAITVYEEAVALHDEVMPRMGQVNQRIEDLQQAMNQMNVRAEPIDEARMEALQSTQAELKKAKADMEDWMQNLSEIPDPLPAEPRLSELLNTQKAQRDRIMEIKDQVSASLAKATEVLGSP